MKKPLFVHLSSKLNAVENCIARNNLEWLSRHQDRISSLVKDFMPSGSGIDCGTKLCEESTSEKLTFDVAFHHMDEHGGYDGWTEHKVIVTASLQFAFSLKITGRDRNRIKEYLHEVYHYALSQMVEETTEGFQAVKE